MAFILSSDGGGIRGVLTAELLVDLTETLACPRSVLPPVRETEAEFAAE